MAPSGFPACSQAQSGDAMTSEVIEATMRLPAPWALDVIPTEEPMSLRLFALFLALALFGTLTAIALLDVGYLGILLPHFRSWGAGQVLADLVITCILGCLWMVSDARSRNLKAWPFVLLTLVAGSFGLLGYLVLRELRELRTRRQSA